MAEHGTLSLQSGLVSTLHAVVGAMVSERYLYTNYTNKSYCLYQKDNYKLTKP